MRRSGSDGRNVASAPPSCDDPRRIRARKSTACRNRFPHSKGEFRRRSWQVAWLNLLGLSNRPIGRSRQPLSCHNGLNEPNNRTEQAPARATTPMLELDRQLSAVIDDERAHEVEYARRCEEH